MRVLSPYRVRARRVRYLFVASLQEGEFPSHNPGDPLLGDERRADLGLPARRDPELEERYLFYACVSRPSDRLYLSWRDSDDDGQVLPPSPFLEDVADLLPRRTGSRRGAGASTPSPSTPRRRRAPTSSRARSRRSAATRTPAPSSTALEVPDPVAASVAERLRAAASTDQRPAGAAARPARPRGARAPRALRRLDARGVRAVLVPLVRRPRAAAPAPRARSRAAHPGRDHARRSSSASTAILPAATRCRARATSAPGSAAPPSCSTRRSERAARAQRRDRARGPPRG